MQYFFFSISTLILFIIGFSVSSVTFGATGDITVEELSTQVENYKEGLQIFLQDTTDELEEAYQGQLSGTQKAYLQSLVCLGLMSGDTLIESIRDRKSVLSQDIRADYVALNARLVDLEKKYEEDLITTDTYHTSLEKVALDIQSYLDNYNALINTFTTTYTDRVMDLDETVDDYVTQNRDLLQGLHRKVSHIQTTLEQFNTLEQQILAFNNAFAGKQSNVVSSLQSAKDATAKILASELDKTIVRKTRGYSTLFRLEDILDRHKNVLLRLYKADFDEEMDNVLGDRYDRRKYAAIQEDIALLEDSFYRGGVLSCQHVLTTNIDLGNYVDEVTNDIQSMITNIERGITIAAQTGANQEVKQQAFNTFQSFFSDRQTQDIASFETFVQSQIDVQTQKAKEQSVLLTQLQNQKQRYDSLSAGDEKNSLRGIVIRDAQKLYNEAVKENTYDYAKSVLVDMGILVEQTQEDIPTDHDNPFVAAIYQLSQNYDDKTVFATAMERAIERLGDMIATESLTPSRKFKLQQVVGAINIYLDETE